MSATRNALGALGVLVGLYGAYLLLSRQDTDRLFSAALWLGGGVIAHDGLIALLTIGIVVVGARVVPAAARPAAVVGLVVLGSVTILAIPMLLSFGAKDDNATLLDRNYWLGWSGIVVAVLLAVVVSAVLRQRRAGDAGPTPAAIDRADPS